MATVVAGPWASQAFAISFFAPLFLGWGLASPLFGLFIGRCIAYYRDEELWKEQTRAYRAFLVVLGVLLAAYQALVCEEVAYWGVSQNRAVEQMVVGHPVGNAVPVLGGLIGLLVQVALSLRAAALFTTTRSRVAFLCTVAVCALAAFAGCLMVTTSGIMYFLGTEASISMTFNQAIALWTGGAAAADAVISIGLYINLRRKKAGYSAVTDRILQTLATLALRTAAYTFLVSLLGMSLALAFPSDDPHLSCGPQAAIFILPPLYGLSLFTTLHSVRTVRDKAISLGGNFGSMALYTSRPGAPTPSLGPSRVEGGVDEEVSDWGAGDEREPSAQDAGGVERDVEKGAVVLVS